MNHNKLQHVITGNELKKQKILHIINVAKNMKKNPELYASALAGKHIALIFEKPSLRTRFSFTAAIHQLGGQAIESVEQTRKSEAPKDVIRVIQGYCAAMMIRTFSDEILLEMQAHAKIPIINGLTDRFHPCQALADLLTLQEKFNSLQELKIAYIGDGNNVLHSLLMFANKLGISVHYCCPSGHGPKEEILNLLANKDLVKSFVEPKFAVENCHAVYTDVWTSMGYSKKNEADFLGFQVNEQLMSYADPQAVFMHCMPMERGKEVSENLPDAPCSVIFTQSENRLHVQKALLVTLLTGEN